MTIRSVIKRHCEKILVFTLTFRVAKRSTGLRQLPEAQVTTALSLSEKG